MSQQSYDDKEAGHGEVGHGVHVDGDSDGLEARSARIRSRYAKSGDSPPPFAKSWKEERSPSIPLHPRAACSTLNETTQVIHENSVEIPPPASLPPSQTHSTVKRPPCINAL